MIALVAWALTYVAHSTVLLTTAWIITGSLPGRALRAREVVWKCALVGGLLTATLQSIGLVRPLGGRLDLMDIIGPLSSCSSPVCFGEAGVQSQPAIPAGAGTDNSGRALSGVHTISRVESSMRLPRRGSQAAGWLLMTWLAAAMMMCLRLALGWRDLRARLGRRRAIGSGRLCAMLDRLVTDTGARGVRLSCSRRITVPLVIASIGTAEICVPPKAFRELDEDEQAALLAHELAHVLRRDPAWMAVLAVLEAVLIVQPLNRIARRHIRDVSEMLCDEWAAGRMRDRLPLARCLVKVAAWDLLPLRASIALSSPWAAQFADRRSPLTARVERLVDSPAAGPCAWDSWILRGVLLLPICCVCVLMPAIVARTATQSPALFADGALAPIASVRIAARSVAPVDAPPPARRRPAEAARTAVRADDRVPPSPSTQSVADVAASRMRTVGSDPDPRIRTVGSDPGFSTAAPRAASDGGAGLPPPREDSAGRPGLRADLTVDAPSLTPGPAVAGHAAAAQISDPNVKVSTPPMPIHDALEKLSARRIDAAPRSARTRAAGQQSARNLILTVLREPAWQRGGYMWAEFQRKYQSITPSRPRPDRY